MKANEAPEKVYISLIPSILGGYVCITVNKDFSNAVEYTQTDVYIKKVEKFLKSYRRETPDKTGYISGVVDDKMIEDFKTYIKGE